MGIDRIRGVFERDRAAGRGTLMPFLVGGYPTAGTTGGLVRAAARSGAGIVEIGMPFSDPVADGPVVASAMHEALGAGASPDGVLDEIAAVRSELEIGLVSMVSGSIVHRAGGPEAYVSRAVAAGIDGFLFPDVPIEESGPYVEASASHGASCSLLIAPTTPDARAAAIAEVCTGFVYVLARSGITGERSDAPAIGARVAMLRGATDLPLAVGFGISTSAHVEAVVRHADAAIVGSALVRRQGEADGDAEAVTERFVAELAGGLRAAPG
ncbi:MAG: tryptophan synthase subunit alpha [Planctomycetota bacterium]